LVSNNNNHFGFCVRLLTWFGVRGPNSMPGTVRLHSRTVLSRTPHTRSSLPIGSAPRMRWGMLFSQLYGGSCMGGSELASLYTDSQAGAMDHALGLESMWLVCLTQPGHREIAAAGVTHLIALLGWLCSVELFSLAWTMYCTILV